MYGVLYAVSPELFPTKDRGTGNAVVSAANRIFGVMVRAILFPGAGAESGVAEFLSCGLECGSGTGGGWVE